MARPPQTDATSVDEIWHLRAPAKYSVGINALAAHDDLGQQGDKRVRVILYDLGVEQEHPALQDRLDLENGRDFDHTTDPKGLLLARSRSEWQLGRAGRLEDSLDAHGTACAGIACGIRDRNRHGGPPDDRSFIGVAPGCMLTPIRISTNFEVDCLIGALEHAADIAELDWGGVILLPRFIPRPDPGAEKRDVLARIEAAIASVAGRAPIVCASGNDGGAPLAYPALLPGVIAVGACNDKGYRSTYSQYGLKGERSVDCVAPSNDVAVSDRTLTRLDAEEISLRLLEGYPKVPKEEDPATRRLLREFLAGRIREGTPEMTELRRKWTNISAMHDWGFDKLGEFAIAAPDNTGEKGYNADPPADYCKVTGDFGFGGTSAACAQVAGVVALMLSAAQGALRGRPDEVRSILQRTSKMTYLTPSGILAGGASGAEPDEFGHGLVDAAAAVAEASKWASGRP
jgi:subtilisin family serine protease